MKILSKIGLIAFVMGTLLVSCEKDNVDRINADNPNYSPDTVNINPYLKQMKTFSSDTIFISCLRVPLPVSFKQASGDVFTVNSPSDLKVASTLADSLVDFEYPIKALVNNNLVILNNVEDLVKAIIDCSSEPVTCADFDAHALLFFPALNIFTSNRYEYTIDYPVTLIVEGQTVVLNEDSNYLPAIGGSPFNYDDTELVYPISIKQFGQTIVLNNDQDVCDFNETLDEDCVNKPAHVQFFFNEGAGRRLNCIYFVDYPVNITFNGTPQQIATRNAYLNLLNANPNALAAIDLVYPVNATKLENGQQISFASGGDLCQYIENCQ